MKVVFHKQDSWLRSKPFLMQCLSSRLEYFLFFIRYYSKWSISWGNSFGKKTLKWEKYIWWFGMLFFRILVTNDLE